jgi:hypothetical protein
MANTPNITTAQIKRLIEKEVSTAFRTQLADSTNRVNPVVDQFGPPLAICIGNFTLRGVLIPASNSDKQAIAALEALAKPKPKTKKAARPKPGS